MSVCPRLAEDVSSSNERQQNYRLNAFASSILASPNLHSHTRYVTVSSSPAAYKIEHYIVTSTGARLNCLPPYSISIPRRQFLA
jgi:hypothetical protein